jgi:phage/conjugal plasmid C-4 type zinc finger TraR family protein
MAERAAARAKTTKSAKSAGRTKLSPSRVTVSSGAAGKKPAPTAKKVSDVRKSTAKKAAKAPTKKVAAAKSAEKKTSRSTVSASEKPTSRSAAKPQKSLKKSTVKTAATKSSSSTSKSVTTSGRATTPAAVKTSARTASGTKTTRTTPSTAVGTRRPTTSSRTSTGGRAARATTTSTTRGTARPAGKTSPASRPTTPRRSGAEPAIYKIARPLLQSRLAELREEYAKAVSEMEALHRERVSDSAGDDQADVGTKTFEREQELTLVNGVFDRMAQVEHALSRLDRGTYEFCERCGNPIPRARLEAFPSVTLCVTCKQLEERR